MDWTKTVAEACREKLDDITHSVYERIDEECLEKEQLDALKDAAEAYGRWCSQFNTSASGTHTKEISERMLQISQNLLKNEGEVPMDPITYIEDICFVMGLYKGVLYK